MAEPRLVVPAPPLPTVAVTGSDARFPVRRIYCVGRNYLDHIREMGGDERAEPFFFQKPADAIVADGETVPYPPFTDDFQFEVELVLAVGREGAVIPVEAAGEHVLAVGVGIDLTRRDAQLVARKAGQPWEIGKAFDHGAPISALRLLDGGTLPTAGAISLAVNGAVRQSGDLGHMIWNGADVIAKLSAQYRLMPGDLIYTGTPAGVGALVPGDRVEASIEGVGDLRITIGPRARA